METEQIRQRIKHAISRIAGVDIANVADNARFVEDLGLDSLSIIESFVAVERDFRLQALPEDIESRIRSVNDAVVFVQAHCRSGV